MSESPKEPFVYNIPAHPTTYDNRRYRSRLEARWAAFFDIIGWRHEYEPFDLGEWSPDFALINIRGAIAALVEVKPFPTNEIPDTNPLFKKMEQSAAKNYYKSD